MKKICLTLYLLLILSNIIFTRDLIIDKTGSQFHCKITSVDSTQLVLDMLYNGNAISTYLSTYNIAEYKINYQPEKGVSSDSNTFAGKRIFIGIGGGWNKSLNDEYINNGFSLHVELFKAIKSRISLGGTIAYNHWKGDAKHLEAINDEYSNAKISGDFSKIEIVPAVRFTTPSKHSPIRLYAQTGVSLALILDNITDIYYHYSIPGTVYDAHISNDKHSEFSAEASVGIGIIIKFLYLNCIYNQDIFGSLNGYFSVNAGFTLPIK
ncbi:MAG: hypothetical protein JW973_04970 [Bacteroidales bacterium]|nr:hypothetical protein [Bacteroidales bacterium]